MMKKIFNLRNVAAIAACLAAFTMFNACGKDDSENPNNPSNPSNAVPDPEGTITANISNDNSISILESGNYIGYIRWISPDNIRIGNSNNYYSASTSICNVGAMKGLGNITQIPTSGFTVPSTENTATACEQGHGYVVKYIYGSRVLYVRLYVVEPIISTSGGIMGAKVKYQYPFVPVPVASVTLSQTTATLTTGNTLALTATVKPDDATNKAVAWTSSNTDVATVSNGTITAVAVGTATITATTEDGSKTATCVVTVGLGTVYLGTVSFASTQTWTVGSQTWSDAVQATGCNKTTFNSACRSNPNYKGDLFSWYVVDSYKSQLCPDGWRVPTRQDFIDLDIALGGTGGNSEINTTLRNAYRNTWGGVYGSLCALDGSLYLQGLYAFYWSQLEYSADGAYCLGFSSEGYVSPQGEGIKGYGYSLRCVQDVQ